MKNKIKILSLLFSFIIFLCGCDFIRFDRLTPQSELFLNVSTDFIASVQDVPDYYTQPFVIINGNIPFFSENDMTAKSFERYSPLDSLGRCGIAVACIGTDIMPTEERGSIGQIKPSGWHTVKYDNVDGKYLYNRCHLIGYQLSGENANEENLITGTRYLNNEGMLPFENLVAEYVEDTNNHVLYRVTPIFKGDNLLASGVLIEAKSVEDNGEQICFNVYVYNVHPDITIDYATGDSFYSGNQDISSNKKYYILNTKSKKMHKSDCPSVKTIKSENKQTSEESRDYLISLGYTPCGQCNP